MDYSPSASPAFVAALTNTLTCSQCGLTVDALRETGLMGCANCYRTFAPLVIRAVQTLHGGGAETAPASPPPPDDVPPDRGVLPWPTKRAASR